MMKRSYSKFTHIANLESICSVDAILAELIKHERVLKGTDIERLVYFSRTFAITNRTIYQACTNGYFSSPALMERLQIEFARFYFKTLNDYAITGHMRREWQIATRHRLIRLQPAGLSLFFAINAHIQCDAVASLRRIPIEPRLLEDDYHRVNRLLLMSSRDIVKSYNPDSRLTLVRELARKILIGPIYLIVFMWRRKAWRTFSSCNEHIHEHEAKLSTKIYSLQNVHIQNVLPNCIDRLEP